MTSPPYRAILHIPRGATWTVRWPVTDPVSGGGLDLSSWVVSGQVRKWYFADAVLATLDVTAGADGYVVCEFDAAVTAAWEFTEAVYGIELADPDGKRFPLAIGPLVLTPEVVV